MIKIGKRHGDMRYLFSDVITTEDELREIIGHPNPVIATLPTDTIDENMRDFIAKCPFVLIASADASGDMDISPKGDPAGFIHVLDDKTIIIPHRPGNRRADTFINILQNPKVGLLFLLPNKGDILRINGHAQLVRDSELREQMKVNGKVPDLLIAVTVAEAFFHCPKCLRRSKLWEGDSSALGAAHLAKAAFNTGKIPQPLEAIEEAISTDDLY
jgi:PPOX class probable FMN-dependent enzyme